MGTGRHHSKSSSDSDSGSDSEGSYKHGKHSKDKKEKKDKKDKEKQDKKHHDDKGFQQPSSSGHPPTSMSAMPLIPQFGSPATPPFPGGDQRAFGALHHPASPPVSAGHPPPPYGAAGAPHPPPQAPPPSGYRVPLTTEGPFAPPQQALHPPFQDLDGSPVFVGSALFPNAVHPCKIAPALSPACRVPYAGQEWEHNGRYDLLPFTPETMEWVPTSEGRIPPGRRPVEGGYEETGQKLFHAAAMIDGVRVPGKTGEHLYGCNVPFGGQEHTVTRNYEVLCWRF